MVKIIRRVDSDVQPEINFTLSMPSHDLSDGKYKFTLVLEGEGSVFERNDTFEVRSKTIAGELVPKHHIQRKKR